MQGLSASGVFRERFLSGTGCLDRFATPMQGGSLYAKSCQ